MALPVLTANTPATGSISWTSFSIAYQGLTRTIAAGNTPDKYVWWLWNAGSPKVGGVGSTALTGAGTLETGNTLPTLTADDILLFINRSGTGIFVQSARSVDGDLIVNGTIIGNHIAANTISGGKMIADTLTAREIQAGSITTSELGISSLGPEADINGSLSNFDTTTVGLHIPSSWTINFEQSGTSTFTVETGANTLEGDSSWKIDVPSGGLQGVGSRAIPCTQGETLTVGVAVASPTAGARFALRTYFGTTETFTRNVGIIAGTPATPTNIQVYTPAGVLISNAPAGGSGVAIAGTQDLWTLPVANQVYIVTFQVKVPAAARFYRIVPIMWATATPAAATFYLDYVRNRPTITTAYLGDGVVYARSLAQIGEVANLKSRIEITDAAGIRLIYRNGSGVDEERIALDTSTGVGRIRAGSIDIGLVDDSVHVSSLGTLWSGTSRYTPGFSGPATLAAIPSATAGTLTVGREHQYIVAATSSLSEVPTWANVLGNSIRTSRQSVALTWTHGISTAETLTGYKVFRRFRTGIPVTSAWGAWALLTTLGPTVTTYTDTGIAGTAVNPKERSTFAPPFIVQPTGMLDVNGANGILAANFRTGRSGRRVEIGDGETGGFFDPIRLFSGDENEAAGQHGAVQIAVSDWPGEFLGFDTWRGIVSIKAPNISTDTSGTTDASIGIYGKRRNGTGAARIRLNAPSGGTWVLGDLLVESKSVPRGQIKVVLPGTTGTYTARVGLGSGAAYDFPVVSGRRYRLTGTNRLVGSSTATYIDYEITGGLGGGALAATPVSSTGQATVSQSRTWTATGTGTASIAFYGQCDQGSVYHLGGEIIIEDVGVL